MTAEVAVLSRVGVALAADSAVTVATSKVYASADKLFQLSTRAPVGIMIYGNADFMSVPWETVIKLFRQQRGSATFTALKGYADAFVDELRSEATLFPHAAQARFVRNAAREVLAMLREKIEGRLDEDLRVRAQGLLEEEIQQIVDDIVRAELQALLQQPSLDEVPEDFGDRFRGQHAEDVAAVASVEMGALPISAPTRDALVPLIASVLTRRRAMSADSGLVVAGFGEREHFPGMIELGVRGVVAGSLLFERKNEAFVGDGDEQSEALVVPFAQTETVHAFMEGIDPTFRRAIEDETRMLFSRFALVVLQRVSAHDAAFGAALEQELQPAIERLVDEVHRDWDERRQKEHVGPVMDMVRALPKDELALMAESLVNLDKFKRRVSRRQETVGGPIDVAVITKGDGFVWVRRKHYFRPELNLRHLASYLVEAKRDDHG